MYSRWSPAYVDYLSGRSVSPEGVITGNRWTTFSHGLAFVLGFSIIFIALGAAASALGVFLYDARQWLAKIGGVVVILFGLHTLGIIRIPFLDMDTRRQVRPDPRLGYLSSALMGVFFSAGWSPCVGPVLGAVLTLALNSAQVTQGAVLLTAYSAGLAIPFLLAALGIGRITTMMRTHAGPKFQRRCRALNLYSRIRITYTSDVCHQWKYRGTANPNGY